MGRFDDGLFHLKLANRYSKKDDYFGARAEYMKAVDCFKQAEATKELEQATKEYEEFVKSDPIFRELVNVLLIGIKREPGILQSQITSKFESGEWSDIYKKGRPILKDDIYYALYFADKFGIVKRIKKGRSYELFVGEKEINEVLLTSLEEKNKSSKTIKRIAIPLVVLALVFGLIFLILKTPLGAVALGFVFLLVIGSFSSLLK